jgi:hypothetical protein
MRFDGRTRRRLEGSSTEIIWLRRVSGWGRLTSCPEPTSRSPPVPRGRSAMDFVGRPLERVGPLESVGPPVWTVGRWVVSCERSVGRPDSNVGRPFAKPKRAARRPGRPPFPPTATFPLPPPFSLSFCPSPPPAPRAQRAPSFERRTVFGDRRTVARRWSDAGPTLRRWPDAGPTLRRSPCQAGAGEGGASVSAGVGLGRRAGRRLGELGRGGGDGVGPLRALHRCREGAWATGGRDAGRDGLV